MVGAVLSLFLLVTKRLYGKEWEWSIGQIKTCRKKQHVKIDDIKEMSDLICGKAAVGGNYNSTRDRRQVLQREIGKEGTFDNDFQKFVDAILLDDDLTQYKKYLYFLLTTEDGDISEITSENYDSRFYKLWEAKSKNDTLSSLVKVIPEDYISIKIIEESGEIDINEGSPGQKSAAVLAFILSSGENPLIIDQPEDDLDNSLIYSLVVKSIRKMKNRRQIIIVTHNPNIPVLGDAEGIIILERNSDGKVAFRNSKKAGCIEEKLIRDGICDIMEGGEGAFKKREQKYLYSK